MTTLELTASSGPWGISYAFNLTPDQGLGAVPEPVIAPPPPG